MTSDERPVILEWALMISLVAALGGCSDAGTHPDPDGQSRALHERVREIADGSDGLERARSFATLLQGLPPEALNEVLQGLEASQRVRGDVELALFAEWWAGFDPTAALVWTQANWRADHARVVSAVIRTWARHDPQSAVTLGNLGPRTINSSLGHELNQAVITGWFESGEPGLLDWVRGLSDLSELQRALNTLVGMRVVRDGPEATLEWIRQSSADQEELRRYMQQRLVSTTAEFDPQLAIRLMHDLEAAGEDTYRFTARIAARWAKRQPEELMTWLQTLPAGEERDEAVNRGYATWLRRDADAGLTWLDSTPMALWIEPAVPEYVKRTLGRNAPDIEWGDFIDRWVDRMTSAEPRRKSLSMILRFWVAHDAPAAESWMDAHPELPEVVRSKTLEFKGSVQAQRLREAGLARKRAQPASAS